MDVTITGNHIGEYRKMREYTQKQLADRLGWSLRKLTSYERGERVPPLTEAILLADFLTVDIRDLWDFELE